jgi:thiamine biosynthesis lipoprotein
MSTLAKPSRRQVLICGGLASGLVASGAWAMGRKGALKTGHRAGIAFGTTVTLRALHADDEQLEAGLDAAWAQIVEVQAAANLFDPDSALSRLNRDGHIANAPPALIEMLVASQEISALTHGAFDITVQPLWAIYEAAHRAGRLPSETELASVRNLIGYRNIAIDGTSVRLAMPGMALTLNGMAQGYATQRCLKALTAHGIADAFLNTGEIGVSGRRDGTEPWTAGIAHPRRAGEYIALARPLDGVLATSGDYATAFTQDFKTNHIFDPQSLQSPQTMASVSVIARSGAYADALATAMMVMEPETSLALARQLGVNVLLVDKEGKVASTAAFPFA